MRLKIGFIFGLVFFLFFGLAAIVIYLNVKQVLSENDAQRFLAKAKRIAEKSDIAPVVLPLPEDNERVAIWYEDASGIHELFRSQNFTVMHSDTLNNIVATIQNERVGWIIEEKNDSNGKIIVALSLNDSTLPEDINRLVLLLSATLASSVLISVVIAYYASGVLLLPVRKIIRKTKVINSTNLTEPLEVVRTGDEMEELAITINEMLQRIENGLQMQNNFFASASHELRTPLSIIQTDFEVQLANPQINESTRSILKSQLEEVRRLSRLVEDFLMLSLLRANMVRLRKENFQLEDLLILQIEKLTSRSKQSSLFVDLQLEEQKDYKIYGDKDKITHVLLNLLENAMKYAVRETTIYVRLTNEQKGVRLLITNIIDRPAPDMSLLTQEFYRGEVMNEGYGLGLWISNKIMEAHEFKLTFKQSEGLFETCADFNIT